LISIGEARRVRRPRPTFGRGVKTTAEPRRLARPHDAARRNPPRKSKPFEPKHPVGDAGSIFNAEPAIAGMKGKPETSGGSGTDLAVALLAAKLSNRSGCQGRAP
jgi:hypothetical protein